MLFYPSFFSPLFLFFSPVQILPRALFVLAVTASSAALAEVGLQSEEEAILGQILTQAGLELAAEVDPKQGWPNLKGEPSRRWRSSTGKKVLLAGLDSQGRVISLTGNGPLLRNAAYPLLAKLTELRSIRIDHNTPIGDDKGALEQYDGAGIDALAATKLTEIKIGHAFDDDGMADLAKIHSLRVVTIGHSRATDTGVAAFANHPALEEFNISSQARPNRVTNRAVASLATLPKLTRLGLHETFLTYQDGLHHLAARRGQLQSVSFRGSLVLPADLERLLADHPGLQLETSSAAELLSSANSRGLLRWASPAAIAWLQTQAPQ
jgi:hypothetical protein